MEIIDFIEYEDKDTLIAQIEAFDWSAAKFLAKLLNEKKFHDTLGDGTLYILLDGEKIVSFATLTHQDCINDKTLYPWIGFVFTSPAYRGNRYSERLIIHICNEAKEKSFEKVYLATDHINLYEKFGFVYMENRFDVYGDDSRVYYRDV
mgnify:FL=1